MAGARPSSSRPNCYRWQKNLSPTFFPFFSQNKCSTVSNSVILFWKKKWFKLKLWKTLKSKVYVILVCHLFKITSNLLLKCWRNSLPCSVFLLTSTPAKMMTKWMHWDAFSSSQPAGQGLVSPQNRFHSAHSATHYKDDKLDPPGCLFPWKQAEKTPLPVTCYCIKSLETCHFASKRS